MEVPSDVEGDEDQYGAFLEHQASLRREQILARKRKKKKRQGDAVEADGIDLEDEKKHKHVQEKPVKVAKKSVKREEKEEEEEEEEDYIPIVGSNASIKASLSSSATTRIATSSLNAKLTEDHDDDYDDDGDVVDSLNQQLLGARFRLLNEQLYSMPSGQAVALFSEQPELFQVYHAGFSDQAKEWPENPVDSIISWLKAKPMSWVVADFGCGDAKIARTIKQKVHSFDLVAANEKVVACDMAHVPLKDGTVDVAVFCLALMGTNWEDFIREAHRVLKVGGTMLIAEVSSRSSDWSAFAHAIKALGFDGSLQKGNNTHFVRLQFVKNSKTPSTKKLSVKLSVCKYKKR